MLYKSRLFLHLQDRPTALGRSAGGNSFFQGWVATQLCEQFTALRRFRIAHAVEEPRHGIGGQDDRCQLAGAATLLQSQWRGSSRLWKPVSHNRNCRAKPAVWQAKLLAGSQPLLGIGSRRLTAALFRLSCADTVGHVTTRAASWSLVQVCFNGCHIFTRRNDAAI